MINFKSEFLRNVLVLLKLGIDPKTGKKIPREIRRILKKN